MVHDTLMSARLPTDVRWVTAQHEGRLLLFYPSELKKGIKTSAGTSDAVVCHRIVDLDTAEVFERAMVFGAALVPNLIDPDAQAVDDRPVCGRLVKGDRGAWLLAPHTQEELYKAQEWIQENLA